MLTHLNVNTLQYFSAAVPHSAHSIKQVRTYLYMYVYIDIACSSSKYILQQIT